MAESRFVYVTYIRTTPEKLWQALIDAEFTRQYWLGMWHESDWEQGKPWRIMIPDGRIGHSGKIVEIDPGRKLVLEWRNEFQPELQAEGYTRAIFQIEPQGEAVKLSIVHESDEPGSKMIETISSGWPRILASLKSLLETGEPLDITSRWPRGL